MRLGAFVDSVVPNYYPSWEYTSCLLAVCGAVLKDFFQLSLFLGIFIFFSLLVKSEEGEFSLFAACCFGPCFGLQSAAPLMNLAFSISAFHLISQSAD